MEISLQALTEKNQTGFVSIADNIFATEFKPNLVHQVVTAYLSGRRAGTKAQKTRSEVNGGGIKPWRQKGTGRARSGTSRSPIWRGGGIVFAASPRDHSQKVNKKMYRVGMRSILSELLRQERLVVVDSLSVDEPKTKLLVNMLKDFVDSKVTIITDEIDTNLGLASRNLYKINVVEATKVDPLSLVGADKVIVTLPAMKRLEEVLA